MTTALLLYGVLVCFVTGLFMAGMAWLVWPTAGDETEGSRPAAISLGAMALLCLSVGVLLVKGLLEMSS